MPALSWGATVPTNPLLEASRPELPSSGNWLALIGSIAQHRLQTNGWSEGSSGSLTIFCLHGPQLTLLFLQASQSSAKC